MRAWINKQEACEVAEKYGEFQYADAQGDVRHQYANDVISRHERIRAAAPMLLEALQMAVSRNEYNTLMTGEEIRVCLFAINAATKDQS